jgi:hypothetical protein
MTGRTRTLPTAAPLRLFAIADASGALAATSNGHVLAWIDRAHADSEVGAGGRVVEFVAIVRAPARATAWGDGQFDDVELGPGLRAALRVTEDGRVLLTIPGGEHDITAGAGPLGLGVLEVGRRAAERREAIAERAGRSAPKRRRRGYNPLAGKPRRAGR